METSALEHKSVSVREAPADQAERIRETVENALDPLCASLHLDAGLKQSILDSVSRAVREHDAPRYRRRLSVGDKADETIRQLRSLMAELSDLWDCIDMEESARLIRVEIAFNHMKTLLNDMLKSEKEMVENVLKKVTEYEDESLQLRTALGLPPFNVAAFTPGSLKLWKALEADVKMLTEERDKQLLEQNDLFDKVEVIAERLGLDPKEILPEDPAQEYSFTSLGGSFLPSTPKLLSVIPESILPRKLMERKQLSNLYVTCSKLEADLNGKLEKVADTQSEMKIWATRMRSPLEIDRDALAFIDADLNELKPLDEEFMDKLEKMRGELEFLYQEWLANLESAYNQQMERLTELWDLCYVGEGERLLPMHFDPSAQTDDSIERVREEVTRLEQVYTDRQAVYEKLSKWKHHWSEKLAYEQQENDPRKYTNRGGNLQQQLNHQKALETRLLPNSLRQLEEAYEEYLNAHPDDEIRVDGAMDPPSYARWTMEAYLDEKELDKRNKVEMKKRQLDMERKFGVSATKTPQMTPQARRRLHPTPASCSKLAPLAKRRNIDDTLSPFFASSTNLRSIISPTRTMQVGPKTSSPKASSAVRLFSSPIRTPLRQNRRV